MAALTGDDIITAVKDHIGNRDSGEIGSRTVDEAVLDSLNRGLFKITKKHDLDVLKRNLEVDVTEALGYKYTIPVLDVDSNTVHVKNFVRIVVQRVGEVHGFPLTRLATRRRDSVFPVTNSDHPGMARYYSVFNDTIELYPFPEDNYTLFIRSNIWPTKITTSTSSSVHPLGEEFDEPLVNFTVADIFAKLQQTRDAREWMKAYRDSLRETVGALRDLPDAEFDMVQVTSGSMIADPFNNPFVRSFNS